MSPSEPPIVSQVSTNEANEPSTSFWFVIKMGLLAGVIFGCGYWYAKLTTAATLTPSNISTIDVASIAHKQEQYRKIQDRIKLDYHQVLSSEPRRDSIAQANAGKSSSLPQSSPQTAADDSLPEPQSPKLEERKPSSDRLAKALETVLGQETPETVSSTAASTLPTATGSPFAVQVASFPDRKAAEEFANRLSSKGYPARLVQAEVSDRGTVYRVRIHGYQTKDEAEEARIKLAEHEKLEAITVSQ